jgi:transcriptional regulator with GAF, ATPase, and Fis domain
MAKSLKSVDAKSMEQLQRYPWPGNIRELQNVIERAVILTKGPVLNIPGDDLRVSNANSMAMAAATGAPSANSNGTPHNMRAVLDDAERQQITAALEQSNWIVAGPNGAAARLGIKRSTLQSRMQKLGMRVSRTGA